MTCHTIRVQWRHGEIETLADIVGPGLDVLFVGLNPSCVSVERCHYHQGRLGQQFWNLLVRNCFLPQPDAPGFHDELLLSNGLGITDVSKVPTARAYNIDPGDLEYGRPLLQQVIRHAQPRVVCFIYKRAAETFLGRRLTNVWGLLDETVEGSQAFVLPFPYRPSTEAALHMRHLGELAGRPRA